MRMAAAKLSGISRKPLAPSPPGRAQGPQRDRKDKTGLQHCCPGSQSYVPEIKQRCEDKSLGESEVALVFVGLKQTTWWS